MGPRWSEQEIYLLFDSIRKHGKSWWAISEEFKHARSELIYPRTEQMIEAVYLKNKTYLSIPSSNPTDFAAIMADHYDSFECTKTEAYEEDLKKYSPGHENFEIPKKRLERPFESRPSLKKPSIKKIDVYEVISKLSDPSFIHSKKLLEGCSRRSFPNFEHSAGTYLCDYATNKSEEPSVSPKFLQWCKAEWFYSYIDRAFFSHNEFEEVLRVLKLSESELFTKYEFQLIRNIIGRPRRFSCAFLSQERKKLAKYREAVKVIQQGKILPSTYHDMLPYINLNKPSTSSRLMVGQRALAIHPATRELRSGSILTLDSSRYHIQFDRPELGVTPVTDLHILPLLSDSQKLFESEETTPTFVYKSIQEREVVSPNFVIDGFKAGVNIYAMAFLLKLLERKEALIELLKQYNAEFAGKIAENAAWRPDNDLQQQYAWIVRDI